MIYIGRWTMGVVVAVLVFGVLFALPNFLPETARANMPGWLPRTPMSLGLDLQGGSYMLLEVDIAGVQRERLETIRDDIRVRLGQAQPRIGYTGLELAGGEVSVNITEPDRVADARVLLNELVNPAGTLLALGQPAEFEMTAGGNGDFTIRVAPAFERQLAAQTVSQSIEVVRRRIDELGTREPTIQQQGADRILVQVPGLEDPAELARILQTTARMTFHLVDESADVEAALQGRVSPVDMLLYEEFQGQQVPIVVQRRIAVSGDRLTNASLGFSQQTGLPIVNFRFDATGARQFADITRNNVGRRFAIVLDDRVISAPRINTAILGGQGYIEGGFTTQTASELSVLLNAGALPANLTVIEERSVGAELGADSVSAGSESAILGLVLVIFFMLLSYGLFGIFATAGLTVNLILLAGVMSALQATLTLPGIAGIVLTIGMSVDANVLIYERIREELRGGRTPIAAIDSGFRRAMSAIVDSNLTTVLAALILFQLGSGPVRGFAVTLGLGIITSFFSAIMVTRMLIVLWMRGARPKALAL